MMAELSFRKKLWRYFEMKVERHASARAEESHKTKQEHMVCSF